MQTKSIALALLVCALLASAARAQQKQSAENAAVYYWQAFELMPDAETRKSLEPWRTVPLNDKTRKDIGATSRSLHYLQLGANSPMCDWQLRFEEGPELLLPHLAKSRDLSRLACLRARIGFASDSPESALDDVVAVMAMGRHVASSKLLINLMVGLAIEQSAIETTAESLLKLSPQSLDQFAARLEKIPPMTSASDGILAEKSVMIPWLEKRIEQAKGRDLKQVLQAAGVPEGQAKDMPDQLDPEQLVKTFKDLEPIYEQIAQAMKLPFDQFQKQAPELQKKIEISPMARTFMPAFIRVYEVQEAGRVRMVMLKAGIAVARHGKEKLAEYRDPAGVGGFVYKELPDGFELVSAMKRNEQPVSLAFRKGGAP